MRHTFSFSRSLFFPQVSATVACPDTKLISKAILLPTYKPTLATIRLVSQLLAMHPDVLVVVIDDCTPHADPAYAVIRKIRNISHKTSNLVYLRTKKNALKAGALNFGLNYIVNLETKILTVFVFDDDILINENTLPIMCQALFERDNIGAVCSRARVLDKNFNILTRLQSLEYQSFNMTKIADNYFLAGPMVMQGMLTGFRTEALRQVNGFSEKHLIEDYDMTARLKRAGWKVTIAPQAEAWTDVPQTFSALWRQRVRWCYGGLFVVRDYWHTPIAVFQDLIGHALFLVMLVLIGISLPDHSYQDPSAITSALLTLMVLNFGVGMAFNMMTLADYKGRDWKDWLIKMTIVPEFIYSNILSLILLGSYLFFMYNLISGKLQRKISAYGRIHNFGLQVFAKFGFSSTWGTKLLAS